MTREEFQKAIDLDQKEKRFSRLSEAAWTALQHTYHSDVIVSIRGQDFELKQADSESIKEAFRECLSRLYFVAKGEAGKAGRELEQMETTGAGID